MSSLSAETPLENVCPIVATVNERDDGPTACSRPVQLPLELLNGSDQSAKVDFDYTTLPIEIRTEAKQAAVEIKSLMRRAVLEVGAALARIKERLPHGQFRKWLSAEFGLTERTAQNYMRAAALASKYETISDLRPKTLYLLASPSTPDSIRQTVIERFGAGDAVPDRTIKEMIKQEKIRQCQEPQQTPLGADPGAGLQPTPEPPVDLAEQAVRIVAVMPEEQRVEFLAEQVKSLSEVHLRTFMDIVAVLGAVTIVDAPETEKSEPPSPKPEPPKPPRKPRPSKATEESAPRPAPAPGLVKAASIVAGKTDPELMAHMSYSKAVELFNSESDKATALEFARTTYFRRKSGEAPKEMTAWQTHCWHMPDDVRGCFVRHTQAPTQLHA